MPIISVIVPVFNTEKYVEECIESIQNQTLRDIEIIIVDDGSTDNSKSIVLNMQRYDQRIKFFELNCNKGVGAARNLGIENSTGDYIAFVDSDDFIKKDMYEKLYREAENKNAEIVICDSDTYSSDGRKKNVWFKPIYGKFELEKAFHNTQPTNKLISRKLVERINFRYLDGMGESIIFELMLHARYISTVDEKLYVYRSRENSLSTKPNIRKNYESLKNNEILRKRNLEYIDYFTFKMIEDLLQIVSNAVKLDDYDAYRTARNELKEMDYLKDNYLKTLYKNEYSLHRYIVKVYIIPFNYTIARLFKRFSKS